MLLTFQDLLFLAILSWEADFVTGKALKELVNAFLSQNKVPVYYSPPMSDNMRLVHDTLSKLKRVDLIENNGERKGYNSSTDGDRMILILGQDWRTWPVQVEYTDNKQLVNHVYAEEFRKEL